MTNELMKTVELATHDSISKLWLSIRKEKLYSTGYNIYMYVSDIGVFKIIQKTKFNQIVKNDLNNFFNEKEEEIKKIVGEEINKYTKLKKIYQMENHLKQIGNLCLTEITDNDFENKLDKNQYAINFRNGIFDLKKNIFRKRTEEDYCSLYLDYDFSENVDKEIKEKIETILKHICNDNDRDFETVKKILGYCLVGDTKENCFFYFYGPRASNGKSTIYKMFDTTFNIFCRSLDKEVFSCDNQKSYKQLINIESPIRAAFIEEVSKKKQDTNNIKIISDPYKFSCEVMYGTSKEINIVCKIIFNSNDAPRFNGADNGVARRGVLVEFRNTFLKKEDYKGEKGTYLQNVNLISDFMTDARNKIALCHILLPYAVKYVKEGLKDMKEYRDNFNNIYSESDRFSEFIDQYFQITKNEEDKISRNEITDLYNKKYNTKVEWATLLSSVKRLNGIDYSFSKRCVYNDHSCKGVVSGLKKKNEEEVEEMLTFGNYNRTPSALDTNHMDYKKMYEELLVKYDELKKIQENKEDTIVVKGKKKKTNTLKEEKQKTEEENQKTEEDMLLENPFLSLTEIKKIINSI